MMRNCTFCASPGPSTNFCPYTSASGAMSRARASDFSMRSGMSWKSSTSTKSIPYALSLFSGEYVRRNLSPPPPVIDEMFFTPSSLPTAPARASTRSSVAWIEEPSGIQTWSMNWGLVESGKKFCLTLVKPKIDAARSTSSANHVR